MCLKVKEVVDHAVYCGVRGPWTFEYMRQMGAAMDRVRVSGDPAMLSSLPAFEAYVENQVASAARFLIDEKYMCIRYGVKTGRHASGCAIRLPLPTK